jgi:hypothetical protein
LQKNRAIAFSIHFDKDEYSRSYYPYSKSPIQENLLFENVVVQAEKIPRLLWSRRRDSKAERNAKVEKELTEEYVLYLVVQELDKGTGENWYLYAPLLQSEMFKNMLDDSKEERPKITKKTDGEIDVYGLKFTKT